MSDPITKQFSRSFKIALSFTADNESLRIQAEVECLDRDEPSLQGNAIAFPIDYFHNSSGRVDVSRLNDFCEAVAYYFPHSVGQAVSRDIAFHLIVCAHLVAATKGIGPDTYETIVPKLANFHTSIIFERLRSLVGQQRTTGGRPAKWSTEQLTLSILVAMRQIKKPALRTYPNVAKKLQTSKPGLFGPKNTADALKKLVTRHGLNWDELKQRAMLSDSDFIQTFPMEIRTLLENGLRIPKALSRLPTSTPNHDE